MYTFIAYFIIYFASFSVRALREVYLQVFHSQSINVSQSDFANICVPSKDYDADVCRHLLTMIIDLLM